MKQTPETLRCRSLKRLLLSNTDCNKGTVTFYNDRAAVGKYRVFKIEWCSFKNLLKD
jgi:hypothetical protein